MKYFLISLILVTTESFAHGLNIFANNQQNQIVGNAYYADQTPANYEQVLLYDQENALLQKNVTNEQGRFQFTIDKPQTYKVVVKAGEGHQAETLVIVSQPKTNNLEQQLQQALETKFQYNAPDCKTNSLEKNLTHILQQEMQSLKEQLHRYETKIRWHDILGGLGYIFGLAGFFLYFKTRKT